MYEPKTGDSVTFANTYDNKTVYQITDVSGGRVEFASDDGVTVSVGLPLFVEMGATPVAVKNDATGLDADAVAVLGAMWAVGIMDFLEILEAAMLANALFGPVIAEALFPLAQLTEASDNLAEFGNMVAALEALV